MTAGAGPLARWNTVVRFSTEEAGVSANAASSAPAPRTSDLCSGIISFCSPNTARIASGSRRRWRGPRPPARSAVPGCRRRGRRPIAGAQPVTLFGALSVVCELTLLGRFDKSTMVKTVNKKGDIDHVTCLISQPVIILTLPSELHYISFTGTLPTITRVRFRLLRSAWRINIETLNCLAIADATDPSEAEVNLARGQVGILEADQDNIIRVTDVGASILCDFSEGVGFRGNAKVTNLSYNLL